MNMGTTAPPWRFDAAIRHSLQLASPRRPTILRYASSAAVFPISQEGPVSFNRGHLEHFRIKVMCQKERVRTTV
ncbi:MAG: hypothetical protein V7604_4689 [Hyphomicrobiales bacterium]|jgi:hypothetical protein